MEAGLCLLLLLAFGATAFNLDVRIPVIKVGAFDSYFGYSVAQHRTLRSLDYGQSLLLVGAPRDDNLQPNTTRSGALWQCRLSSDTKVQQHGVDGLSLFGALRFCAPLLFLVVHAIHNYAHEVAPPPWPPPTYIAAAAAADDAFPCSCGAESSSITANKVVSGKLH
jgi:hypothetical protein